jgi:hypothetical protein
MFIANVAFIQNEVTCVISSLTLATKQQKQQNKMLG